MAWAICEMSDRTGRLRRDGAVDFGDFGDVGAFAC
jgi:hypothetical protein